MIYQCHKCGCKASEDNWVGGFDVNKMTCERCRGIAPIAKIQILEPNVTVGVACIRRGSSKPLYCMIDANGVYFDPTIQQLNNTQLTDILDHRVHIARTNLSYNSTHSFEWEDEKNNRLLTFDVYAYVSKFIPAKTYGPPEDCYPAEGGEIEGFYVVLTDAELYDNKGNTVKTMKELHWRKIMELEVAFEEELEKQGSIYEFLQEKLFESAASASEDYNED